MKQFNVENFALILASILALFAAFLEVTNHVLPPPSLALVFIIIYANKKKSTWDIRSLVVVTIALVLVGLYTVFMVRQNLVYPEQMQNV